MKTFMDRADAVMASTYGRYPIVLERGEGVKVFDMNGKEYTDFVAGIAVINLGHAREEIAEAISRQARTLLHVSNLYYTRPQTELAEILTGKSFADKVFFCNSGAEANEAAIKLARYYFSSRDNARRHRVISMKQSFHGRTMATLSATGQEKIQKGFSPLLPGFEYVPFNDIDALYDKMDDTVAAVMLEPIQGEGGIIEPDPGYLNDVRELCDDAGALLVFDEIQTGMGRTGTLFAYESYDVEPDIMTLAKALGNGLPIGAMLAKDSVAEVLVPGSHASTFGGTPIITAGALATVKIMTETDVIRKGKETGMYFRNRLTEIKDTYDSVLEVRGKGLLLGIKISGKGDAIVRAMMEKGFLINCVQGDVLRFVPPLIIDKEDIDRMLASLVELL